MKYLQGLKRLRYKVGRRGTFLLFLTMLDFIYAYGLAFPTKTVIKSQAYIFLSQFTNLHVWAALWALVGGICLVFAFKEKDAPAYAAAMFLKALWALLFLLGWMFAGVERGYL